MSLPGVLSFFPQLGQPPANHSIHGYSSMLFDFLTATNIRVILAEHYPFSDLAVDDFGYYCAISDFRVIGRCQCNGHASTCSRTQCRWSMSAIVIIILLGSFVNHGSKKLKMEKLNVKVSAYTVYLVMLLVSAWGRSICRYSYICDVEFVHQIFECVLHCVW